MSLKEEETHTHSHTLSHTHRSGLKGEAALSSLQKLETSKMQGNFFFMYIKAKVQQSVDSVLRCKMLLSNFRAYFARRQFHVMQR